MTLRELQKKNYSCTDKVISDLECAFRQDFTDEEACAEANISHDTYYRWLKESEEFARRMNKAKTHLFRKAKHIIATRVIEGEKAFDCWELLKRRQKKLYSEQVDNNLSGELKTTGVIHIGKKNESRD